MGFNNKIHVLLAKLGSQKIKRLLRGTSAKYHLSKKLRDYKNTAILHVAFIVYEPAMWDKQEPVYQELLTRSNVEVYLIVVPDTSLSAGAAQAEKAAFFHQKYSNTLAYDEDVCRRFAQGEFHYTFYQTPYCFKYPVLLQPYKLVKHTKICFIPYGYVGSSDFFETTSKTDFFENVYFGFMDNEIMQEVLLKKFHKTCQKGLQHFLSLGYPSFEYSVSMDAPKDKIENVLWVPRWSYAEKGGGSHFLEYKDAYTALAKETPQLNWTMRPHPLMFPSMATLGLLTEEEITAYRQSLQEANVELDENSLLNDALAQTDLLLADYSSIIIMYFLSGRPIIYCDCNIEMNGVFADLRDAMYIANSWDDVLMHVNNLKNGIDPLKNKRLEIAARECEKHKGSAKRIVDRIIEDFGWTI